MNNLLSTQNIEAKLISIKSQQVLIDRDVATLYGVQTKRINEAVKNNPDKFPAGYMIALTTKEWSVLRSKFSTANFSKTRVPPKAFTEKGLYMLATILKSKQATETTLELNFAVLKLKQTTKRKKE